MNNNEVFNTFKKRDLNIIHDIIKSHRNELESYLIDESPYIKKHTIIFLKGLISFYYIVMNILSIITIPFLLFFIKKEEYIIIEGKEIKFKKYLEEK